MVIVQGIVLVAMVILSFDAFTVWRFNEHLIPFHKRESCVNTTVQKIMIENDDINQDAVPFYHQHEKESIEKYISCESVVWNRNTMQMEWNCTIDVPTNHTQYSFIEVLCDGFSTPIKPEKIKGSCRLLFIHNNVEYNNIPKEKTDVEMMKDYRKWDMTDTMIWYIPIIFCFILLIRFYK